MPASQHFRRAAAGFREIEDAFAFAVIADQKPRTLPAPRTSPTQTGDEPRKPGSGRPADLPGPASRHSSRGGLGSGVGMLSSGLSWASVRQCRVVVST